MSNIQIELLYFSDCENYRKAYDVICETLGKRGLDATIKLVSVNNIDNFELLKFKGSPTVLLNGRDVEGASMK